MSIKNPNVKKKTKAWYRILAPESMNKMLLGESTVYNKQELQGKRLKLSLFAVTNDMKKQNMDASFKVVSFEDNNAITQLTGVSITMSSIKRLVRRGRNKIDDSFTAKTKDLKLLRIKPVMITNNKTNKSVTTKLRIETRNLIRKGLRSMTYEEFFNDVISLKVQKELKDRLNKIYPLKFIDIREAKIEKENVTADDSPVIEEPVIQEPDEGQLQEEETLEQAEQI